jgi:hypothetical protein
MVTSRPSLHDCDLKDAHLRFGHDGSANAAAAKENQQERAEELARKPSRDDFHQA